MIQLIISKYLKHLFALINPKAILTYGFLNNLQIYTFILIFIVFQ